MSNKTPYEIRLALIDTAKDLLTTSYFAKQEAIVRQWESDCRDKTNKGEDGFPCPALPDFPTEVDIVKKAEALYVFVSNDGK